MKTKPITRSFQQSLLDSSFVHKAVKSALATARIRARHINIETDMVAVQRVTLEGVIRCEGLSADWKLQFNVDIGRGGWGAMGDEVIRDVYYDAPFYEVAAALPVVSTVGAHDRRQGLGFVHQQIIELNDAMYRQRRRELETGEDQALFNVAVSRMFAELSRQIETKYRK